MNISFGSNYFITRRLDFPHDILDQLESMKDVELSQEYYSLKEACETGVYSKMTLNSPDEYDSEIERILISNNIDFSKSSIKDALDLENIKSRMMMDPSFSDRYKLVLMDTQVLDELFKMDEISYIEPHGTNGLENRYEDFCEYLKTGKKIYAPIVVINDWNEELSAGISDGRHRFAVLRDMGMKQIPVAIPNYSVEIAKKYKLL